MQSIDAQAEVLWSLLLYIGAVLALTFVMIGLSYFLGERRDTPLKSKIYESGIDPTGQARFRFSSQFYLVALFFVIFDLEAVFIIAWAVAFEEAGWWGYWGAFAFIFLLGIVLLYEWRTGALDFGPSGKKILKAYRERIANKSKQHS